MAYVGELAAVGTSLCFSFGSVLFTLAGRELGATLVNRVRLVLAALFVVLLHWLTLGQPLPLDAAPERWFWLGLSGFVGLAAGDAFLFQAFVLIGPRLAMLMMALAPVFGVVLAGLFLGETLALAEMVGISVTLLGIMTVISERRGKPKETADPQAARTYLIGLLCGLGGAIGQAGGLVISKIGLAGGFPALSGNLIRLIVAMTLVWAFTLLNTAGRRSLRRLPQHPRAVLLMLGGAFLGPVVGVWLSLIAIQQTSIGVAATLSSLMPIFLIPISYVVFKERITRQAVLGTLIAFVGTMLLFV